MIKFIQRALNKNHEQNKQLFTFCTNNQSHILGEYVIKSKMSGSSEDNFYEKYKNFNNISMEKVFIPGTTIVRNKEQAHKAVKVLKSLKNREHAWDTETIDLNAKLETQIGKGRIICASAFCGIDADFGNGPRLFIDNFGQNQGLINIFQEYLEDNSYKKIWHNYGFDRHIFNNHGINVSGFGGDTMQMARLADPSRGPREYSLAAITQHYEEEIKGKKKEFLKDLKQQIKDDSVNLKKALDLITNNQPINEDISDKYMLNNYESKEQKIEYLNQELKNLQSKKFSSEIYEKYYLKANIKSNMKQLFGRKKQLKDGKVGKTLEFPNILRMHTDPELIEKWIRYSSLDAEVTFYSYYILQNQLRGLQTDFEDMKNNLDIYNKYWHPFGEILTDMEKRGFELNLSHLDVQLKYF